MYIEPGAIRSALITLGFVAEAALIDLNTAATDSWHDPAALAGLLHHATGKMLTQAIGVDVAADHLTDRWRAALTGVGSGDQLAQILTEARWMHHRLTHTAAVPELTEYQSVGALSASVRSLADSLEALMRIRILTAPRRPRQS
ncbi:hypothetical protein [Nocardia camponoti]|uniref:Uncharacterized protein n=1 Tax=Nocardia camponoti TaxID=1616106 RepID=A0A917VCP2_9NOCA|nr:hypothetical protein [Nocardia camponoti]GGK63058.1 hypothetical protein GCM10011591_39170 [Nocardia camponoti]